MFVLVLLIVLLAACARIALSKPRSVKRAGEIVLLYLVVGYCGIPMLPISIWCLAKPDALASAFGFPAGNPFQLFFGFAYLGMSILSLMSLVYRRSFLIAPAICWAVFFAGATYIHLKDVTNVSHGGMIEIFLSHGFISLLLIIALLASGLLKERA